MKAVVGLLLIFTGLTIGYLVLAGKLPSGSTAPTQASGGLPTEQKRVSRNFSAFTSPAVRGHAI